MDALAPWPGKYPVLGVGISATAYEAAVERVALAALERAGGLVTALPVHGVVTAARDPALREAMRSFHLVVPDGQPVRWALTLLHGKRLEDRVYGPELMLRLCRRAAQDGVGIYLYGSTPEVVTALRERLLRQMPRLRVVGWESPPFRPLTAEEDREVVARIEASGAGLLFVGLGCPLQDRFAFEHRRTIRAVQVCVGAAFDFHAGTKRMAPPWMQRRGLEWLFRLSQEPRRLARRYLVTNTLFVAGVGWALARGAGRSSARRGSARLA